MLAPARTGRALCTIVRAGPGFAGRPDGAPPGSDEPGEPEAQPHSTSVTAAHRHRPITAPVSHRRWERTATPRLQRTRARSAAGLRCLTIFGAGAASGA